MEVGGFRVRLDLSHFFSDIKKFSCIYVDLSRDRQIADVVDRISELFGIERPLFLLDERFYLPESENVNALRDSNIVKVLGAFHIQGKESCSTTDHHAKRAKGGDYLRHDIHSEQVSIKNNKPDISEDVGSHYYQNEKVDSVVPHKDKAAFHELRGKKRKHELFGESKCINSVSVLQQDVEPEIHYQKKCKRKKEKVKKDFLNGSSVEPLEDETEEKNSDDIHFDNKTIRKKKRNKSGQVNGDITEENSVSQVLNHNLLENASDHNEQETCESIGLKKRKKKRKDHLTSLNAYKILDSEPVHSTDLKKLKKNLSKNYAGTDVAQDQSLSLSCEKTDTTCLTICSQGAVKCGNESTIMFQNIDSLANSGIENHDSIDYADKDFAHRAVSSTPTFTDGCKSTEVADTVLEDNTSIYDSTLGNFLDNATNTAIGTKPKRKRTRARRQRKRNGIQNDNVVTLPSVVPQHAVLQPIIPPRKHIRFEEGLDENLKENTSHKDVSLNNYVDMRNNTTEEICNTKASPNVNDECTHELTPGNKVTDCETKNSFEYPIPENSTSKNNTSSPSQIAFHQQWALNTDNQNVDSKESLQKLLILGKQNSVPVVFERKIQCNSPVSASESLMPVPKPSKNKSAEETCDFQNTTQVEDQDGITCLKTNLDTINPCRYPSLKGKPKKNDIIAFKKLKMTNNYTPEVSDFIIATVMSICENTFEMMLQIEAGESEIEAPKGRFFLDTEDSEQNENDTKICQLNWNELMDVRILFP